MALGGLHRLGLVSEQPEFWAQRLQGDRARPSPAINSTVTDRRSASRAQRVPGQGRPTAVGTRCGRPLPGRVAALPARVAALPARVNLLPGRPGDGAGEYPPTEEAERRGDQRQGDECGKECRKRKPVSATPVNLNFLIRML